MNALDAIYQVLTETGKPLPVSEITRLTPEATISASLSSDIKEKGVSSRFVRTGPSHYSLNPEVTPAKASKKPGRQLKIPVNDKVEPQETKTYSFTEAAEYILKIYAGHQPMHYGAITEKALELKLLSTKGLTPEATMYAQILTESERRKRRGGQPRFLMHGKGMVGLAVWEPQGLAGMIDSHNREVRKQLLLKIRDLPAKEFEELIARLLAALGFENVTVTPYSGDQGIDIRGTLVVGDSIHTRMAVQVKKWKNNIQAPIVQQVRGSLSTHEQGLIITTSDFSKGAVAEANQPDKIPVGLMNGERLVDLLIENDIGIIRTSYDLIEMGENGLSV